MTNSTTTPATILTTPRTTSLEGFLATLNLVPEAVFRKFGQIIVLDAKTDDPRIVLIPKNNVEVIDLPKDQVCITGMGFAWNPELETAIMRLSAVGYLPTKLASQVMNAIDWRGLLLDETYHAEYGFFPGTDVEGHSHFLSNVAVDDPKVICLSTINGKSISNFEFAGLPNGDFTIAAIADGKVYTTVTKVSEVREGASFSWSLVDVKVPVRDISMRIVEGVVGTVIGTDDGIRMYRDSEIVDFKATTGKKITALVAGFAGDPRVIDSGVVVDTIGFVTSDGKVFATSFKPTSELTPVKVDEDVTTVLKATSRIIPGNDSRWYVSDVATKVAAIDIPRIDIPRI